MGKTELQGKTSNAKQLSPTCFICLIFSNKLHKLIIANEKEIKIVASLVSFWE